ncbi:uncharacterized protein NEPG_00480 [Nematocida parisii ERTm1]|uniref:uncharacterized protein n=1 Tax=Nematocida parisii (strain ERTm1 / ATCC PRA-289) TaxID=881290 RepID=UPI000264B209|nr:uncharacterized protein NEPG_00480 [Nematocida parisii ERTm1]EIJ94955.1 hypothetical protein NEPG_00480 [Nematocida parisii ERTm1]|eukprot:XP_013058311.1 hypothetical protein NEPG_00480 [Nematocida parisii ERTm1]
MQYTVSTIKFTNSTCIEWIFQIVVEMFVIFTSQLYNIIIAPEASSSSISFLSTASITVVQSNSGYILGILEQMLYLLLSTILLMSVYAALVSLALIPVNIMFISNLIITLYIRFDAWSSRYFGLWYKIMNVAYAYILYLAGVLFLYRVINTSEIIISRSVYTNGMLIMPVVCLMAIAVISKYITQIVLKTMNSTLSGCYVKEYHNTFISLLFSSITCSFLELLHLLIIRKSACGFIETLYYIFLGGYSLFFFGVIAITRIYKRND